MASALSNLSLEEFERLYDGVKPYREYWFGEAIPKPAPNSIHGVVQFVLMLLLSNRGWKVASEVRLKMAPYAEPLPDVIASRNKIEQPYPTKPVEICIEILSPQDRLKSLVDKAGHYLDWGVQYVWLVDPDARTAWVVSAENREGVWVHPDGNLSAGPATEIPLSELFAEVDKRV